MTALQGSIGIVVGSSVGPGELAATARNAEQFGFAQVWTAEDYFFTGGVAGLAIALEATDHIKVGTGVVAAVSRHPALLAMEFATLGVVHPGRVVLGLGLGLPLWMNQMGLRPTSQVATVRAATRIIRRLLDGDEVTTEEGGFSVEGVRLAYPVPGMPIHLGVIGPKMMALSADVADGTILSILCSPEYVRWARRVLGADHHITAFAIFNVDDDSKLARDKVRHRAAFSLRRGRSPLTDAAGITDELTELLATKGAGALIDQMPDAWVDLMTVSGTPDECVEKIRALFEAGADQVALFPNPGLEAPTLTQRAGESILPRFKMKV